MLSQYLKNVNSRHLMGKFGIIDIDIDTDTDSI